MSYVALRELESVHIVRRWAGDWVLVYKIQKSEQFRTDTTFVKYSKIVLHYNNVDSYY
jgi:predicted RNA-binding protein